MVPHVLGILLSAFEIGSFHSVRDHVPMKERPDALAVLTYSGHAEVRCPFCSGEDEAEQPDASDARPS